MTEPYRPAKTAAGPRGLLATLLRVLASLVGLVGGIVGAGLLLAASLAPTAGFADQVVTTLDEELLRFPPLPPVGEVAERSTVLARDGSVLAVLHSDENRRIVRLADVPLHAQQAVVATEDLEYRSHEGVNWRAIARAAVSNAQAGEITSGASTITQQLVKNVTSDDALTFNRKLKEVVYAVQLEERLTKDQILEEYLNRAYFGNGIYGIGTAAEFYFGVPVRDLAVPQAALLAGLIRSPEGNDPIADPRAAQQRRNIVLDQMGRAGFLPADGVLRAQDEPLELDVSPLPRPEEPAFVDYIKNLAFNEPSLGPTPAARRRAVFEGGLTIRTTLDPRLQTAAQETIDETLDRSTDPLGTLTAIDPATGELLAAGFGPRSYGSRPGQTKIYPAVPGQGSPGRQPGSSFKVFGLVAALEEGVSPAYTTDTPSPYTFRQRDCGPDGPYQPGNYSDSSGGVLDMEQATGESSNVYFAHLVDRFVAPSKLVETARRMGITNNKPRAACSTVLGTSEVFPLDMTAAFSTLANHGARCAPHAIAEVRDRSEQVLFTGGNVCEQAVDREVAARATDLLRAPLESGTAASRGALDRPAAGKTGTTQDYGDAWFVGYVPQLSVASWVGNERPSSGMDEHPTCGGPVTGGCLPTIMWQRFMKRAIDELDLPEAEFDEPPPLPTDLVPTIVGRPVDEAEQVLKDAGFFPLLEPAPNAGTASPDRTAPEPGFSEGERVLVARQEPTGGDDAPEGSAVRFTTRTISRLPAPSVAAVGSLDARPPTPPSIGGLLPGGQPAERAADRGRRALRELARQARRRP